MTPLENIVAVLATFLVILIAYYKWRYQYWRRRNLPYLEPTIPFGNFPNPFWRKDQPGIALQHIYQEIKSKQWKHGGIFSILSPAYVVADLEYVKNVMVKDFQYFVDRGLYYNERDDPLSAHLFAVGGNKWRSLRTKLTPTFTSGKMKMMFPTLLECEKFLHKRMEKECENKRPVDIKDVLACFTTDIIGSCAFGLNFNTFEQEDSPFRMYGKRVFQPTTFKDLQLTFSNAFPEVAKFLGFTENSKDLTNFFMKIVKDTVQYREKNNVTRKDFMQLLVDLKNNKSKGDDGSDHHGTTLTIEELAAQCFVFFLAGYETSSTTMAFALYELAKHQDIQDKLRREIEDVLTKHGGKVTYDSIQDMKYLHQVIEETLRKYPPVVHVTRVCVKDYKIPDEDVVIKKGTMVMIPIYGIHHDPEFYPNPEKFDPDRFSDKNKNSIPNYSYMPFGEGPRICLGMRFGLMQSKAGLTSLLRKYNFKVNGKTQEPLRFQVNSFVLAAEGEIWLDAQKI